MSRRVHQQDIPARWAPTRLRPHKHEKKCQQESAVSRLIVIVV
jgi:hypothetical protein